ncbi:MULTISPECIES: DUF4893 domain-containing protein [unclassified Mesorhizobium]|uniref:DUF4893 domain-containing protein n=1 Tax=unclassified Mesorhizobium TaxID=325217 RepID=UPI000FD9D9DC|nr:MULTISPECIES: DUF4893 domain-containing protein [unclassified Mesorhizobium]RWL48024.1 MAG: DUF4893 domain-containing protein [Mesorhizobium sp.]TGQ17210.1 DUF4893 domain-containing protein [Mesorhizobium sp. M2E.F.Ca.ET.219.01.1.1]TGS16981.1 DUF4893 domain-containing protein [Mesorhizobium sp. M2E.F.Ca.ET.209.01.1.1]TGT76632.1 DUF4893 domain-containing protein [Mesorhizobium sp. M2E.F.Ca.ET.166.01.1.1]TGW02744.1 DUF4893 domain-containing protein [Mesorhizobium sp. M2E.F.Ca.ET.154.01.1.1]
MTPRLLFAALGLIVLTLPAHADGEVQKLITAADKARLDKYGETRKAALDEAKAGDPAEVKQLDELLAKPLVAFSDKDLTGNWKCRTIKAGGISPLVIYGWFKCKVTDDGSGWRLAKISGSQRTTGRFFDDNEKRAIYLGSFSVNDDKAKPYGSGPESDQVGYAFRNSATEWRIEFPAPYYESKLDIMEFKR